jgi:multisubunit Na+/H+ antiporter MnhG subunit
MPAVAWVTIVIAAVIIAVAALGLLRVIFHLRAVAATLDDVIGGVGVIADRTSAVPEVLPSVNASLAPVRDFCEAI